MKTEENLNTLELQQPVTLTQAAKILKEKFPRFFFDSRTLQTMCIKQLVPHLEMPTCGLHRKVRYLIRVGDLVKHLKRQEKSA